MTFEEVYNKLNIPSRVYDYFVLPFWKQHCDAFAKRMLPEPSVNFLSDSTIIDTMFVTAGGHWLEEELKFLENSLSVEELEKLLKEPDIGGPHLMVEKYKTSHNAVHHLYHLEKFEEWAANRLGDVVEWGGGFGSMARIALLNNPDCNYTIIDLPIFCTLQWHYLNNLFPGEVAVVTDGELPDSRITIVPLHHADVVLGDQPQRDRQRARPGGEDFRRF